MRNDTNRFRGTTGSPGAKVDRRGTLPAIEARQKAADRDFPIRKTSRKKEKQKQQKDADGKGK